MKSIETNKLLPKNVIHTSRTVHSWSSGVANPVEIVEESVVPIRCRHRADRARICLWKFPEPVIANSLFASTVADILSLVISLLVVKPSTAAVLVDLTMRVELVISLFNLIAFADNGGTETWTPFRGCWNLAEGEAHLFAATENDRKCFAEAYCRKRKSVTWSLAHTSFFILCPRGSYFHTFRSHAKFHLLCCVAQRNCFFFSLLHSWGKRSGSKLMYSRQTCHLIADVGKNRINQATDECLYIS